MQTKILVASALVGVVLILSGSAAAFIGATAEQIMPKDSSFPSELSAQPSGMVVDVSGAVVKPGVYLLPAGSRLDEALKMAGGISQNADPNYLSKSINLSQKITDGMKIYIPQLGEIVSNLSSLIDINSASADQLDKLPGIGPTTAQTIITKRPYQTINDLVVKKVVSKSVFSKIEKLIVAR